MEVKAASTATPATQTLPSRAKLAPAAPEAVLVGAVVLEAVDEVDVVVRLVTNAVVVGSAVVVGGAVVGAAVEFPLAEAPGAGTASAGLTSAPVPHGIAAPPAPGWVGLVGGVEPPLASASVKRVVHVFFVGAAGVENW